ncbi:pacifastin-like protease inhibitor cvp4 [Uranotaenia lowii]|uniref:pacifastin-like protease inhibitor cvp4 n=1 Tax=Uranotaenia lowii TaxID=190385 RepID=UPI00247A4545|nr:pacifastin-like protease inhibitor cvp4 [Uranotaenia lowii]
MRSFLLIAALLVAAAVAVPVEEAQAQGLECVPNSSFMDQCNRCRCSSDGKVKSCTRKQCVSEEMADDPRVHDSVVSQNGVPEKEEEQVHTNGQVCTPNEVKMEDCNRCKCANNGIGWFCTRKACPPKAKRDAQMEEKKCVPGTNFKAADGCNQCFCTDNGQAACTLMECESRVRRNAPAPEPQCKAGTTFKSADGCNDCFCTDNGIAACTQKFCFPKQKRDADKEELPVVKVAPYDPSFTCTPGSRFKYECNTCFCHNDGKTAACTFKYCIPGEF